MGQKIYPNTQKSSSLHLPGLGATKERAFHLLDVAFGHFGPTAVVATAVPSGMSTLAASAAGPPSA